MLSSTKCHVKSCHNALNNYKDGDQWNRDVIVITEAMNNKIDLINMLVQKEKTLKEKDNMPLKRYIKDKRAELWILDSQLCLLLKSSSSVTGPIIAKWNSSKVYELNKYFRPTNPFNYSRKRAKCDVLDASNMKDTSLSLLGKREIMTSVDTRCMDNLKHNRLKNTDMHQLPRLTSNSSNSLNYKHPIESCLCLDNGSKHIQRMIKQAQRDIHNRALHAQQTQLLNLTGDLELTIKQASAVYNAWSEACKPLNGEEYPLGALAMEFFDRLFTRRPEMKAVFADIRMQSEFFAGFIDLLIPSPNKRYSDKAYSLDQQAQKYAFLSFDQDDYESVYEALTDVVRRRIEILFDSRTKESWYASCRILISSLLIAQVPYHQPPLNKPARVPRPLQLLVNPMYLLKSSSGNSAKNNTRAYRRLSSSPSVIAMPSTLDSAQKSTTLIMKDSIMPELTIKQAKQISVAWEEACKPQITKKGEKQEMPLTVISEMFFEDFFARYPASRQEIGNSLRLQAGFFTYLVSNIVPNVYNVRDIPNKRTHYEYIGSTREMYKAACEALTHVLRKRICDRFNTALQDAWTISCNRAIARMLLTQQRGIRRKCQMKVPCTLPKISAQTVLSCLRPVGVYIQHQEALEDASI